MFEFQYFCCSTVHVQSNQSMLWNKNPYHRMSYRIDPVRSSNAPEATPLHSSLRLAMELPCASFLCEANPAAAKHMESMTEDEMHFCFGSTKQIGIPQWTCFQDEQHWFQEELSRRVGFATPPTKKPRTLLTSPTKRLRSNDLTVPGWLIRAQEQDAVPEFA